MEKEKLSDIEQKIINATLKYLKGKDKDISIVIRQYSKENSSIVGMDFGTKENLFWICYPENGEDGEMTIYESSDHKGNYKKQYKSFLSKEIPGIKDRLDSYGS